MSTVHNDDVKQFFFFKSQINKVVDNMITSKNWYGGSLACVWSHCSRALLFVTLWTTDCWAPLSKGFSRQEDWSGLPCPPPALLHWQVDSLLLTPPGKPSSQPWEKLNYVRWSVSYIFLRTFSFLSSFLHKKNKKQKTFLLALIFSALSDHHQWTTFTSNYLPYWLNMSAEYLANTKQLFIKKSELRWGLTGRAEESFTNTVKPYLKGTTQVNFQLGR